MNCPRGGPRRGGTRHQAVQEHRQPCPALPPSLPLPLNALPRPACLQDDALLDDIIDRLLDVRTGRPGKQVALSETEVRRVGQRRGGQWRRVWPLHFV